MKTVCVVGLGYIGLPSSILFARSGFSVIGYDIDAVRVARIQSGDPVIAEPDVQGALREVLERKTLQATTQCVAADYFVIAVPTPWHINDTSDAHNPCVYVYDALEAVSKVLKKGDTIIIESTVPVGTTVRCAQMLAQKTGMRAGIDFYIAYCPERVLPGKIMYELVHNARTVGGLDDASSQKAVQLYAHCVSAPIYVTSASCAEMVKLVENSSRDVQMAFAHQVASMSYAAGVDPYEVIELANKHPRVKILQPRSGVGGHCIAVDPHFLMHSFPLESQLLHTARMINNQRPTEVIREIIACAQRAEKNISRPVKTLLVGLTYKPDVDDLRESPALAIAQKLTDLGYPFSVFEPHVERTILKRMGYSVCDDGERGLVEYDLIAVLVDHTWIKQRCEILRMHSFVVDACGVLYQPRHAAPIQANMQHSSVIEKQL